MGEGRSGGNGQSSAPTVRHPWLCRATRLQLAGIAVIFGTIVWMLLAGTDLLATVHAGAIAVPMAVLDSLVGLACGALLFKLLIAERARHQRMNARLHVIADINHHIRNALDQIEMTAHITHNQQVIAEIDSGVQRIDWTLRELLPETADEALE